IGAIAAIVAGLVVISSAGMWGAAWSRVAIQCAMAVGLATYLARYYGCAFPVRAAAKTLLAAVVSASCSLSVVLVSGSPSSIPIAVALSALVYLLLVRAWGLVVPEDLLLLEEVATRLPRRAQRSVLAVINQLVRPTWPKAVR